MIEFQEGYHTYYVYSHKAKTVLYTGVTNNLKLELNQHKESLNLNRLQQNITFILSCILKKFTWIQLAIAKEIKDGKEKR
jgi:putative endonuclease